MIKITCPKCQEEILLIPDVRVMSEAVAKHVELHTERSKEQGLSTDEVQKMRSAIEDALIEEIVNAIYEEYLPNQKNNQPNKNRKKKK